MKQNHEALHSNEKPSIDSTIEEIKKTPSVVNVEKHTISIEDEKKIADIQQQIAEVAFAEENNVLSNQEEAVSKEIQVSTSKKSGHELRNAVVAGVTMLSSLFGAKDAMAKKSDDGAGIKQKTEKLTVYTKAATKEGSITPTGLSNAFHENDSGLQEKDLLQIAEKYRFDASSNIAFQRPLWVFGKKSS